MKYHIQLNYKDNNNTKLTIPAEEAPKFFECLDKKALFFSENTNKGFWTNIDDIRNIILEREEEQEIHSVEVIEE
ncbi:MAG: hypothetical protein R3230_01285 [Nitrosopumilaceae archaeon]|nr:hypothetical protein [Nitrosopumilaceae archaeon]